MLFNSTGPLLDGKLQTGVELLTYILKERFRFIFYVLPEKNIDFLSFLFYPISHCSLL